MKLLSRFLKKEVNTLIKQNIQFDIIGDISKFSKTLQKTILDVKAQTENCTGMTQILAINYGSRDEITRAINKAIKNGDQIKEDEIDTLLDTANFPDVDLLIRSGGEQRLSNFLLWQSAYAELIFTKTLWPEFSSIELKTILEKFNSASRRFGAI